MLDNFKALGINKDLVKGLNELGIKVPTEIQSEVIPLLLDGKKDLLAQAQTGTGKTAAFGLPILQSIDTSFDKPQALILCPTRELGQQVAKQLFKYTKYSEKVFTECVYGGEQIEKQISRLNRTTHIVVATPGRLLDLIRRKDVDIRNVTTVVLDEADEMLSMGFKDQLDQILNSVPEDINKWLFSATMPDGIIEIVNNHMAPNAQRVTVSKNELVNKNIEHKYLICEEQDKFNVLMRFLLQEEDNRGVIFCKTKAATQKLAKQLLAKNIPADAIHGDLKQKERDKIMRAFKNESLQILVATDLAARGIDIQELAYVVHYQLPDKDEYYTHRSGRTARAGNSGVSMALITHKETRKLKYYENTLGITFHKESHVNF